MTLLHETNPSTPLVGPVLGQGQPAQQDTLQTRLQQILGVVDQCHDLMVNIEDRITGARPDDSKKEAARPLGLASLTMDLSGRCLNLRARLEEVLNAL